MGLNRKLFFRLIFIYLFIKHCFVEASSKTLNIEHSAVKTNQTFVLEKGDSWFEQKTENDLENANNLNSENTLHYLKLIDFEDVSLSLPFDSAIPDQITKLLRTENENVQIKMAIRYYSVFNRTQFVLSLCAQHTQDRCQELVPTAENWVKTQFDWNWVEAEHIEVRLRFVGSDGEPQNPTSRTDRNFSDPDTNQANVIVLIEQLHAEFVLSDGQKFPACSLFKQRNQLKIIIDGQPIRTQYADLLWNHLQWPTLPTPSVASAENHFDYPKFVFQDLEKDSWPESSSLYTVHSGIQVRLKMTGDQEIIALNEEICVHLHYWVGENRFLQVRIKQINQKKRLNLPKLWPTYNSNPDEALRGARLAWYPARFCFNWFVLDLHRFQTNQLELEFVSEGDVSFGQLVLRRTPHKAIIALSQIRVERNLLIEPTSNWLETEEELDNSMLDREDDNSTTIEDEDQESISDGLFSPFDLFEDLANDSIPEETTTEATNELRSPDSYPMPEEASSKKHLRLNERVPNRSSSAIDEWKNLIFHLPKQLRSKVVGPKDAVDYGSTPVPLNNFVSSWNTNAGSAAREWHLIDHVPPLCGWFHDLARNQITLRYRPSPVVEPQTTYVFSHWIYVQGNEQITLKVQSTIRSGYLRIELINDQLLPYMWHTEYFNTWPLEKESELFVKPHLMNMYPKNAGKIKFTIFQDTFPERDKMNLKHWEQSLKKTTNATIANHWHEEDRKWQSGDWQSIPEILLITQVQMADPCNDPNSCNHHGRCVTKSATELTCVCQREYHGQRCEFDNRCRLRHVKIANRTGIEFCKSVGGIGCRPIENWFDCQCPASQRWDVHERRCVKISPCLFKMCGSHEVCRVQSDRSARCECRAGYVRQSSGCERDLCRPNPCNAGQLCRTQPGRKSPICFCKFGYYFHAGRQRCEPDSPSMANPFIVQKLGCSQTYAYESSRTGGGDVVRCACFPGYRLESDEITCTPEDLFQRNRCPLCNKRQVCVRRALGHMYRAYTANGALMTTDAIYRCKCRVGFFGRNCEHNVCQARASEPMQQSHQRSYDDSILKASGSDAVHDAFSGMNAFGEPVKPHKKQELDDSAYYSQRRKIRYAGQNASEGLIQSSGKHRVIRPPASYFQTWEGRARSYFSNASAPAMSELHPIIMLQYERDALYFYCYNSKCEHSEDHHRVRFRCHCPPEWSSVDESNGMCRFRFVCGEQDQMECSSRGAVCVPRSASTGVGLVAQCECPVGFVFNSDRICQPICDFAGKTCERFQADKCEPTLHRNRVRCLCQAGHVFDAEFGRCVVATDVLRVRMNVRLNLLWPFEYALNAPAPPATSDDNRAHNFDEYAHEDDLFVPSIADDIIGPATFAPDLPDTQPPALNPINCLHYHQTGACVDWLQQVRNQQRQSAANLQKQLQLRMRMRQSLQLTFDQLVGPEAIVKITVLSLPNESSGSITDFTVEFTVDVMSPDRFAGRKLLDLFQVTCVRIDRLNQVYLHPPLLIDSIKYDDLDPNDDDDEMEWKSAVIAGDEWPFENSHGSQAMEGCAMPSGLYVVDRKIETRSINLCDTSTGKPLRCVAYSKCDKNRTENSRYRCKCTIGFEKVHSKFIGLFEIDFCRDIDECSDPELNKCDRNSKCVNTIGSYKCRCLPGYKRVNLYSCKKACDETFPCEHGTCRVFKENHEQCICDAGYRDDDCSKLDPEVIYFQTTIATFVIVMVLVVFGVFTFSYMIAKKIELETMPKESSFAKMRLSTERFPEEQRDSYGLQILEASDMIDHHNTTHSA